MVLHKELRVCDSNLPVILVENKIEICRGTAKKLLMDCSNGTLPSNSFVGRVDVLTKDNINSPKFRGISFDSGEFDIKEPHLVIKIKTRE